MKQTENQKQPLGIGEQLKTLRESAGLSLVQLSQLSGLSEELMMEIEADNFSRISSLPYLKGILKKYARFCQADYQELFGLAKNQVEFKQSGKNDLLPPNRFKLNRFFFRFNWHPLLIVVFIFLAYLIYQLASLALPPKIILADFSETSSSSYYLVSGKVWGKTKEFFINGERVFLKNNHQFEKNLYLSGEVNLIELKAINYFGQETKLNKMVIFQSAF
ncbi:MAG: helix-turn-helix domain-containing protein [Patescibacteria group bacterium]